MSAWTADDLRRIGAATELRIASQRPDGTLRGYTTIWCTALDDAVYIRSAAGPENGWFRRALRSGIGRISAGGVEKDVTLVLAEPEVLSQLDAVLHAKYDRFGPGPIAAITGSDVLETTLKVMPRG